MKTIIIKDYPDEKLGSYNPVYINIEKQKGKLFFERLNQVLSIINQKHDRTELRCLKIEVEEDKTNFIATDGHRLGILTIDFVMQEFESGVYEVISKNKINIILKKVDLIYPDTNCLMTTEEQLREHFMVLTLNEDMQKKQVLHQIMTKNDKYINFDFMLDIPFLEFIYAESIRTIILRNDYFYYLIMPKELRNIEHRGVKYGN